MPKVTELFAFVACDKDEDDEGIMAMHDGITWVPMVGADMERVNSLRSIAQQMAFKTRTSFKIMKFKLVETIQDDYYQGGKDV